MLIALGLEQTADTGQLADFTDTLTHTASAVNTVYGYRLYKFTDSLGSIYLKVGFGTRFSTLGGDTWFPPFFALSIGTGTDGAGNLVNATPSRNYPYIPPTGSSSLTPTTLCYAGMRTSYGYAGEGLMWVAMKVGVIRQKSSSDTTYILRASLDQTLDGFPLLFFAIARPQGLDGQPQPGAAALVAPSPITNSPSATGAGYPNYYTPSCDAVTEGGSIKSSCSILAKPAYDVTSMRDSNLYVGVPFMSFGSDVSQLYGIASLSAPAVASGDTLTMVLGGTEEQTLFIPHRGIPGIAQLNFNWHGAAGNPGNDTLALRWEGDSV